MEFSKAFDKVPHMRLLDKWRGLGVEGKVLEWIREDLWIPLPGRTPCTWRRGKTPYTW